MGGKNGFFILTLLVAFVAAGPVYADIGASAGITYGLSVPDAPNVKQFYITGFKGAARLAPWFSTGGYVMFSDSSGQPGGGSNFKYSLAGVESIYRMPQGQADAYFGARFGITKIETNPNGSDVTFSPYHYGIVTGYEYTMFERIIIGFEGSYIHVQRGKTLQNGATILYDSFNIMNFLISLQFKF